MNKITDFSYEEVQAAIQGSVSIAEVILKLGMNLSNGRYVTIKKIAKIHNLELPKWDNRQSTKQAIARITIPNDEFFVNGVFRAGTNLRKRLISLGRQYTCENKKCLLHGLSTWNEELLSFQVDHINGDNFDNRIENLRFLCPNCHTQTETYARNNKKSYAYCLCGRRQAGTVVDSKICIHTGELFVQNACLGCGRTDIDKTASRCLKCEKEHRIKSGKGANFSYPPIEEIIENIERHGYLQYGLLIGVSDNAIRKHLRKLGLQRLPKKLNKKNSS